MIPNSVMKAQINGVQRGAISQANRVMCGSGDLKPTKGMWANGKPSVSEKRQSHLKPFQAGSIPAIPIS